MKRRKFFVILLLIFSVCCLFGAAACDLSSAAEYTITFDYNGGAGDEKTVEVKDGYIPILPVPTTVPDGMEFDGWRDAVGNTVKSGEKFEYDRDITLKAVYSLVSYRINYGSDGVAVRTDALIGTPVYEYSLSEQAIALPTVAKTGYTFLGWLVADSSDVITEIAAGMKGDLQLTAIWQANEHTINFDYQGGEGTETLKVTYGEMIENLPEPTVCPAGKRFRGWKDADGVTVINGTRMFYADGVTLTAEYTYITYTISYKNLQQAELGEHPMGYQISDTEIELPQLQKAGYAFLGWQLTEDGDAVAAIPAGTTGDLSLTAVWQANEYEITFDYNGGDGTIESIKVTFGENIDDLPEPTDCPAGNTFVGWKDENGDFVVSGTKMVYTENVTFTAEYAIVDYKITYNVNGGKITGVAIRGYSVSESAIDLPDAEKDGHTFTGWQSESGVITAIPAGTTGDLSLTAVWQANEYEITFDYNGGAGTTTSMRVTFGGKLGILPEPTDCPAGREFMCWKDADGSTITAETVMDYLTDVTFIAEYKICIYEITYDVNGGKLTGVKVDTYYISEYEIPLPDAEKDGCTFIGWRNGETIFKAIPAETTGDLLLVAEYEYVLYNIEYDENGGTLSSGAIKTYHISETQTNLPTPKKDGYKFMGWQFGGDLIKAIPAGTTGDIFLTAKWEKTTLLTITFDNTSKSTNITDWADGTVGVKQVSVEYGGKVAIPKIKFDLMTPAMQRDSTYSMAEGTGYWYYINNAGKKVVFDASKALTTENFADVDDLNLTIYVNPVRQWAGPY